MLVKNKVGYELLEYIPIRENEIEKYENITGAGVIVKVNNKYLIGYNNWRLQWEIPAGRIEIGETPREAAARELYEETHQKIDNMEFKGLFKKRRPSGEIVYMAIFYSEKDSINKFVKQEDDEMDKILLWDLKEDIGDVDEIDLKIIELTQNL